MNYKIKQNRHVNQNDYVKAHMTKGEIQGMEALQGHFTSIDTKTGLREFSHLIPHFKNHHILNFFDGLEKQLTEFGDIDEIHKRKYEIASKKRPPYVETASESTMKKLGRGKDKHLVLLPKEIAAFFIKANGKNNSINPKTGYLEFGREGKWGKIEITGPNWSHSGPESGGGGGADRQSRESGDAAHRANMAMHNNRKETLEEQMARTGLPHNVFVDPMGGGYAHWNGNTWDVSSDPYTWGGRPPEPVPERAPEPVKAPSKLATALEYGGTILGYLLGGPLGGQLAGMLGSTINNGFNPSTPTRAATAIAKHGFAGNPIFSLLIDKIGNKIANNIPLTSQEALTQHLHGNLNYHKPYSSTTGKVHHTERESPSHVQQTINQPSTIIEDLFENVRQPKYTYGIPNKEEIRQKVSLKNKTEPSKNQFYTDPFTRSLKKLKEQETLAKEKSITREIEEQRENAVAPPLQQPQTIKNNSLNPMLNDNQKEAALHQYAIRNPINKTNPFEAREDDNLMRKNAYREYYQANARKINPVISTKQDIYG